MGQLKMVNLFAYRANNLPIHSGLRKQPTFRNATTGFPAK